MKKFVIWILRGVILVIGFVVGYFQISRDLKGIAIGLGIAAFVVLAEFIINKIPLDTLVAAGIGIVLGFVVASLIEYGLLSLGYETLTELLSKYSLIFKSAFVVLGLLVAVRKKVEIDLLDKDILRRAGKTDYEQLKILDTSVIIDGRIADICETKFLTGPLIVPQFVLTELHKLADSSESTKRVRARRGLEILQKLQDESKLTIKVYEKDYPELKDVDTKIIQLAKELNALTLTTDYNLNKIATLQGITILNINDLANALKPIYLPGETMFVYVVKEGKERDQGVGYLDDGTMVVVEDGRRFIGRKIDVVVTSTLQTSAGRMIFTRPH
ncbi:MAG: PIN domain-containing protein [Elusimicrobiota bacterium]|nr:PIN domain-containing protein [Elusimicrobiota bacterium]